jgi:hypothetical protein
MSNIFTDIELELPLEVSEMATEAGQIVTLNQTRVAELLADYGDEKPQFPILRVEAGLSNNNNNWSESLLVDIAEQVNKSEKPGYWGHIKPDERGYVFPDPETLWLGATVKREGGKQVLYVKGYNIPGGRARRHRSLAKVTSWAGKASGKVVGGVRMIEKFALESIDWARPGAEGMNARVVGIATEMEGSDNEVDDLSKVTVDQLRAANPSLFTLVKNEVEKDYESQVQEMTEKAKKADEAESLFSKLRTLLKIDEKDDIVEAVTKAVETVENVGKGELREKIAAYLKGKVKSDSAQSTLMRLIPVTEMAGKSDEEIGKYVDEFLTTDDDAKSVVTEMEQAPAPLTRHRTGDGQRDKIGSSGMVRKQTVKL